VPTRFDISSLIVAFLRSFNDGLEFFVALELVLLACNFFLQQLISSHHIFVLAGFRTMHCHVHATSSKR